MKERRTPDTNTPTYFATGLVAAVCVAAFVASPQVSATSINVTARIIESTCAYNISSGASGSVDLGDWSYTSTGAGAGPNWDLLPVSSSGVATGSASATVTIDPSCSVIGMAGLVIEFPQAGGPTPLSTAMQSAIGMTIPSGPVFALTSNDQSLSLFPVWVEAMATTTSSQFSCVPGNDLYRRTSGGERWFRTEAGGWVYGEDRKGSTGIKYVLGTNSTKWSGAAGAWVTLAAAGIVVDTDAYQSINGLNTWTGGGKSYSLADGPLVSCTAGEPVVRNNINYTPGHAMGPTPGTLATHTSYHFRFSGPRSIPKTAWPVTPPAPGTQYSGTIQLTMSYL